jgi:hypothetical protein
MVILKITVFIRKRKQMFIENLYIMRQTIRLRKRENVPTATKLVIMNVNVTVKTKVSKTLTLKDPNLYGYLSYY